MKIHKGGFPDTCSGWGEVARFESDSIEWVVFCKSNPNGSKWINVKIAANGKAPKKANYWINWNGKDFAKGKCYKIAEENRPEFLIKLRDILNKTDLTKYSPKLEIK